MASLTLRMNIRTKTLVLIQISQVLRAVFWFDTNIRKDFKGDALTREALNNLLHRIKLLHCAIGDHGDAPSAKIFEVHPDLLRDTGAEADRGGRHLKSVLLERLCLRGRCIAAVARVGASGQHCRLGLVVARVGVARTGRWVCILDGTEEAARTYSRLGSGNENIQVSLRGVL
ncbi:hypothetical protein IF2G_06977 [Cordyceps javanica]|nr:hypothetical protein IF2G_06977 [Cordyceps javanica]